MFNVNELTSRLADMSDPQLQQYAKIHKDDPYTLALAAAESKRRAQLRASGQQQAGMGKPPTVADQALAQIGAPAPQMQQMQQPQPRLPEQQGIGMLPAQNVAGMADGGIAGYGDSYADEYANGGIVAFAGKDGSVVEDTSSPIGRFFENFRSPTGFQDYAAQQKQLEQERALAAKLQQLEGYGFAQQTPAQQAEAERVRKELSALRASSRQKSPAAALEQFQAPPPVEKKPGYAVEGKKKGEKADYPAPIDEGNVYTGRDTASPFNPKTDAGKKAIGQRPGSGSNTGTTKDQKAGTEKASDFVANKPTTLNDELARLEQFNPGVGQYDVLKNKIETGYADLKREREETRPKEKAYTGLEALLGKEEDKAKGKETKNLYMAMINAGLVTMGGKSQYALQNISEGALVGTKQYQEGLEKLEAAALERRKQGAMIEEARRAEARGDWKEGRLLDQQAFEAGLTAERSKIDAVMNIWGVNQKTAVELTTAQNKMASDDARALMQQREETKRSIEQNKTSERVARIYASMRASAGPSLADKAYDNATRQHQLWLNSPEGKVESMTPGASDRKFLQYLDQANKALNINVPSSAAATTKDSYAGWGNNVQITPGVK